MNISAVAAVRQNSLTIHYNNAKTKVVTSQHINVCRKNYLFALDIEYKIMHLIDGT